MLAFIGQYWLEFLLGGIAAGVSYLCKKFYKMYKNEKEAHEQQALNDLYARTQADNKEINEKIDALEKFLFNLKQGILSIQGHQFKKKCRELLKEDHEITIDELSQIIADHDAYNALGGNHEGDELFNLIEKKVEKNLTD